jgi:hypothetical protein
LETPLLSNQLLKSSSPENSFSGELVHCGDILTSIATGLAVTKRNIVEQELTTTEVAPNLSQATTASAENAVDPLVERLADDIVADAIDFPSRYLRRCVTGHDGE